MNELAKIIDAGGTLALALVAIRLLMRVERSMEKFSSTLAVLVERTRGLRVIKGARTVTVTLDPPVDDEK